ncbi:GNAT family N-acetyltransferase [Zobellia galactanivorans]|uniref:GNAT family N-acetyltransferase n=1 Tax=Zobellia galactanivorans (strain DSM 12802 / CCUG 47099 / CIP 106680 / NCIMB 13871 / Dsij) TaxID=63186 RepID=UPI0026E29566|nr:GNAT family N-acetyltransferase [Zobellia galactanivorans]MDO6808619.1 GNAT family N-acetyltransferase [Zobellia galactanivorans]
MQIKRITSSELSLVVKLFDKYRVFYEQASDLQLAHDFLQSRMEHNESIIFVALTEKDREIIPVGFTQLYPKFSSVRAVKNWILNDLFVEAKYRKQGIGEALIKRAMEFAQSKGAKFVELSTAVDNFTAQGLYESLGFKKLKPDAGFIDYRIEVA